jgi:hypothetical protein
MTCADMLPRDLRARYHISNSALLSPAPPATTSQWQPPTSRPILTSLLVLWRRGSAMIAAQKTIYDVVHRVPMANRWFEQGFER